MKRIEKIRRIVEQGQRAVVDGKILDLFSAEAIIALHDHPDISPEQQVKYVALKAHRMATIAFKMASDVQIKKGQ